jgi:hypothetical protein
MSNSLIYQKGKDVPLTSALVGGEWSASHPDRFTIRERPSGTHWIGGWVDPRPGLGNVEKRIFLTSLELKLMATVPEVPGSIPGSTRFSEE